MVAKVTDPPSNWPVSGHSVHVYLYFSFMYLFTYLFIRSMPMGSVILLHHVPFNSANENFSFSLSSSMFFSFTPERSSLQGFNAVITCTAVAPLFVTSVKHDMIVK